MALEVLDEQACFGGVQGSYWHKSEACAAPMKFSVFRPPQAAHGRVPALIFLAGLTCTHETFMIKAGAQRVASELGLMLVAPDTSPRDTGIAGEADDWEVGTAAGFYLDASEAPWSQHFRMESYVVDELPCLLAANFPIDVARIGVSGHSMGGHGALTLVLRHPDRFRSVSALAPIVAPTKVPWGRKAFATFLGGDETRWGEHDACELVARRTYPGPILVDQGLADKYLATQLQPERFEQACAATGQPLTLRRHAGHEHYYWFVQTFIEDHLRHHARELRAA